MSCPGPWKNTFLLQCLTCDIYYFIYYVSVYELLKASDQAYLSSRLPAQLSAGIWSSHFPDCKWIDDKTSQKMWSAPFFLSGIKPDSLNRGCFYTWAKLNFRGNCRFEGKNISSLQRISFKKCKICERK